MDAALDMALDRASGLLLSHQAPAGYWWYTLEANETIGAEYIFLEHCLGQRNPHRWRRLAQRMLAEQRADGSWALAAGLDADLSTTLECYVALRMAGHAATEPALRKAREVIAGLGGLAAARVFTKIHFAGLGILPWSVPPAMPLELMMLPAWAPFSIYSFSSWARACIVPLLIILNKHPVWPLAGLDLRAELPSGGTSQNGRKGRTDIWNDFFLLIDRLMKLTKPVLKRSPTQGMALRRAEDWIRTHLARTEDIFPALSYGALALATLGATDQDPMVRKALTALQRFQHSYTGPLPALPFSNPAAAEYAASRVAADDTPLHQQCCISPMWDTPWSICALRAAGARPDHAAIQRAATWLLQQQITQCYGDWAKKNPAGQPGGWAFEFENDFFPDVDDTIQVLLALHEVPLPGSALAAARTRALQWCGSMQNDDGGWAAFDKNNTLALVNKLPFADHGACLDPSSPDITGRMLLLLGTLGQTARDPAVARAVSYLRRTQETNGAWFGRWGVNYVYGTWAVLQGLQAIGHPPTAPEVLRAADWLASIQQTDGGFGESLESYVIDRFVPAPTCPSQTAWGLMGLIAAGRAAATPAERAAQYLLAQQRVADGGWEETACTGTGFPGHFYIRYHGYRHYFPLLALGTYRNAVRT